MWRRPCPSAPFLGSQWPGSLQLFELSRTAGRARQRGFRPLSSFRCSRPVGSSCDSGSGVQPAFAAFALLCIAAIPGSVCSRARVSGKHARNAPTSFWVRSSLHRPASGLRPRGASWCHAHGGGIGNRLCGPGTANGSGGTESPTSRDSPEGSPLNVPHAPAAPSAGPDLHSGRRAEFHGMGLWVRPGDQRPSVLSTWRLAAIRESM